MKKLTILVLIFILVFALVGCTTEQTAIRTESSRNISVWTDPETGVQYIIYEEKTSYSGAGGITPRLNADGTLRIESEDLE